MILAANALSFLKQQLTAYCCLTKDLAKLSLGALRASGQGGWVGARGFLRKNRCHAAGCLHLPSSALLAGGQIQTQMPGGAKPLLKPGKWALQNL